MVNDLEPSLPNKRKVRNMAEKKDPPPVQVWKLVVREKPTVGDRLVYLAVGMVGGMLALAGALILLKTM